MKFANLLTTIVLSIACIINWEPYLNNNDSFEVYFLDVGQGDSMLIKTPNNHYGIIDSGRDRSVMLELERNMPFVVQNIEFIILTHPDADHIGGFTHILNRYNIKTVFLAKSKKDTLVYSTILKQIEEKEISNFHLYVGTDFEIDGLKVSIVWPDEDVDTYQLSNSNNASYGTLLSFEEFQILAMGDLEAEYELKAIKNLKLESELEVFKVSHHGSGTSTSQELLDIINPISAVIPVGGNNPYGHPVQSVIDLILDEEILLLRTDIDGTIKFSTDGINHKYHVNGQEKELIQNKSFD